MPVGVLEVAIAAAATGAADRQDFACVPRMFSFLIDGSACKVRMKTEIVIRAFEQTI